MRYFHKVHAVTLDKRENLIHSNWQIHRFLLLREKVMNNEVMRQIPVKNARLEFDIPDSKRESMTRSRPHSKMQALCLFFLEIFPAKKNSQKDLQCMRKCDI